MVGGSTETELEYEEHHVHEVYEDIASHFSSTRYKPWPIVDAFLRSLPPGAVGLDVGCGNGKYLAVNKDVFVVASDRSNALVQIASHHQPHSAIVADILHLPHPNDSFDFAISIAVIHHLSTSARRVQAIREILQTLRQPKKSQQSNGDVGGSALIFVWALEQKHSRRGWDRGDQQDVLVPWVLKPEQKSKPKHSIKTDLNRPPETTCSTPPPTTYQRYYHLYREGELQTDVVAAGGRILKNGYDRDNWWAVVARDD
ncbi:tRNA methyltransferase, has a role in tRNA modification [Cladophialophora chaetospira]|uniref:tRNA methyltransferase, has a role in tRNA modification n=1 Tax=Cladophialophora chaetospira TaxID=386627 RepID=A0AA38U4N1_9EURO|nr:tRNA methyltransferase, has a role in tRNA modification [Cladophialophora chaetospira]